MIFLNNGLMQVTEVLYFSNQLGASPEGVGLLFSLIAFGTLIARYPGGFLIGRVGVRPVLLVGLVASGACSAFLPWVGTLLGAGVVGAFAAFFGVVAASSIHVLVARGAMRAQRGRANGHLGLLSSVGLLVGSPLGTSLYGFWPGAAFLASGGSFFVAGGVVAVLLSGARVSARSTSRG